MSGRGGSRLFWPVTEHEHRARRRWTASELLKDYVALKQVACRLAGASRYVFVVIEPTFFAFSQCDQDTAWRQHGGPPSEAVAYLSDTIVREAFPFQILSLGHMARLGPNATTNEYR